MNDEMMKKVMECKSAEEILALAKENGIEMTAEEAEEKFAALNNEGELSDDELLGAAGGGCANPEDYVAVDIYNRHCISAHWTCNSCGEGNIFFYEDEEYPIHNCDNGGRKEARCLTCKYFFAREGDMGRCKRCKV